MFGIGHEEKIISAGMTMKLQGYLLGYSVLQNGVIVQNHTYSTPVKNLVVNSGKNYLLKANNSTSDVGSNIQVCGARFGKNNISGNSGVLAFCARGSGTTPATVNDTGLAARIGNYATSVLSSNPNTGTCFDRANGKVIMRVTHDHEVEAADRNINELGWFGNTTASPVMFSRLILPSTITVLTGQSLRTVYQLEVSLSPVSSTPVAPSITGWTTDGDYRWECAFPATSSTLATHDPSAFSLFDTVGTGGNMSAAISLGDYTDGGGLVACYSPQAITMYGVAQSFNSFGSRVGTPAPSSTVYNAGSGILTNSAGTSAVTVQNYTNGNFYRDSTLVCEPNWTGYSSISIYAIRFRGLMYIFDNPQTKTNTQRLTLNYRISIS